MNLPQLPADKANHLVYGALNRRAIAKGLPPPHGVELLDAAATAAGGLLVRLAATV